MTYYTRTYGSSLHLNNPNLAWQYPTQPFLDRFGIPINKLTFGLEEFNFNPFLVENKMAYIPSFGTFRTYPRSPINELRLMYRIDGAQRFCYVHYATLYNVKSFEDNDIPYLQNLLNPQIPLIYFRPESHQFFGQDFPLFEQKINDLNNSQFIASNHLNSSFLVNVKYEKLEVLSKSVKCNLRASYASNLYRDVIYPCNC
jgi:hypothetical protein